MCFMRVLFFLCFLFPLSGNAQINPPEFLCVSNDSLFFEWVDDTCGPFEQFVIHFSTNEAGPYTILTTISNVNANSFHHPNPAGTEFFYFISIERDCPGLQPTSSDTLNNRPPRVGPIVNVSVEAGGARINWSPSPSPETSEYIIYRIEDNGTFPIDTVSNTLTYFDNNSDADLQSESYFVVSLDPCNNSSIFGESHSSIFMEYALNPCDQSVALNWNIYDDWPQGLQRQELWLSEQGGPPFKVTDLGVGIDNYLFEGLIDNRQYAFTIRAIQADDQSIISNSNLVTFTSDIVEPIRELSALSLSANVDGSLDLNWFWNTTAELNQYSVCRISDGLSTEVEVVQPVLSLMPTGSFSDQSADASQRVYSYEIKSLDLCDSMSISNRVSSILLEANQIDNSSNSISWTPFEMSRAQFDTYELYRVYNGTETLLGSFGEGQLSYEDVYDPLDFDNPEFCYFLLAKAKVELLNGTEADGFVRSNQVCIERETFAVVPNAFAPLGKNNVFLPVLFNRNSLASYELSIWDRWGTLIFQSQEADQGWNGRTEDGQFLPKGIYAYAIKLTLNDGRERVQQGSVLLLK